MSLAQSGNRCSLLVFFTMVLLQFGSLLVFSSLSCFCIFCRPISTCSLFLQNIFASSIVLLMHQKLLVHTPYFSRHLPFVYHTLQCWYIPRCSFVFHFHCRQYTIGTAVKVSQKKLILVTINNSAIMYMYQFAISILVTFLIVVQCLSY